MSSFVRSRTNSNFSCADTTLGQHDDEGHNSGPQADVRVCICLRRPVTQAQRPRAFQPQPLDALTPRDGEPEPEPKLRLIDILYRAPTRAAFAGKLTSGRAGAHADGGILLPEAARVPFPASAAVTPKPALPPEGFAKMPSIRNGHPEPATAEIWRRAGAGESGGTASLRIL